MTDMWSAGCILYELLSGNKAFDEGNRHDTREMIQKGDFSMEGGSWEDISVQAKDFVRKLLQYTPSSRPTAIKALQHVWILEHTKKSDSVKSLRECLTNLKLYRVINFILGLIFLTLLIEPQQRASSSLLASDLDLFHKKL